MDPIVQFKDAQRQAWSTFAPIEAVTCTAAPRLVRFAGIQPGARVLDVGCGTGVVALTAARLGATCTGVDLTPELLARAKESTAIAGVDIDWHEGDAEALPFADASFDVVVSQFGHMFAPRPAAVVAEMLRVLVPGGTLAFSTWPPELFTGSIFRVTAKYGPPLPPGVSPPPQWGDPNIVRERLGSAVRDLVFDRDLMRFPALSPAHVRLGLEQIGPMGRLVKALAGEPTKLAAYRREVEGLIALYFENNAVRQDFLVTRAIKA
jgi:SAM-dependent methyltransferase